MARTKSRRASKNAAGGGLSKVVKTSKKLLGKPGTEGAPRRAKSVEHWAKKVIIAKLKNKFFKVKYGNVR